MPRPMKCRRVCCVPQTVEFAPVQGADKKAPVILTVDEYEAIRLIDKEGFSQEQCSEQMQIARTTVQKIYENARKKIADVLVEGLPLRIEGGQYQICQGGDRTCKNRGFCKQETVQSYHMPKGEKIMKIAVTYENGEIFQHFGHTEQFKVYHIEDGKIVSSQVVGTNGSGHGALAGVLNELDVDVLICGGIGGGAQAALAAANIKLYGGVSGSADEAVESLLGGKLEYNPDVQCSHHGAHHHEGGCGSHGCGEHHSCGGHQA